MLVLTRWPTETIVVGNPDHPILTIQVIRVDGGKVRLGIDAPKDIPVVRGELIGRVRRPKDKPEGGEPQDQDPKGEGGDSRAHQV